MARIKTKQVQGVGRITLEYAIDQFMRHNRLKNLSPRTIEYYTEDLRYFQKITEVTYLDEITDKLYEDFILHEMDKGNKMTAVNCRTRGLRVFLRFCAKKGLSFVQMENFIALHRNAEELTALFNKVRKLSRIQPMPYKYVKSWFENRFPYFSDDQPTFDADGFVVDPMTLKNMLSMVQEVKAANQNETIPTTFVDDMEDNAA